MHELKLRLSDEAWTIILIATAMILSLLTCANGSASFATSTLSACLTGMAIALSRHMLGYGDRSFYGAVTTLAVVASTLAVAVSLARWLTPGDTIASLIIIGVITATVTALYYIWQERLNNRQVSQAARVTSIHRAH